ncbi:MAG: hypothetical protein QF780_02120 [Candidatus Marinimicrobia bacterium]|jgi:hypothetical protein|nr:hypothetical protein [Candidatus Neomarinimicrobiota bacterium]
MKKIYSTLIRLNSIQFKYRTIISFVIVLIAMIGSDMLFHGYFPYIVEFFDNKLNIDLSNPDTIALDFAPEIWGGVLAMVLGTLIIVIAIAAESSPKLMDLFVKDWLSLVYVWFLIIASLHAVLIMFYVEPLGRVSSSVLNTYIYLFIGSIFTLPYIFYILLYSKTSNVVSTISSIIQGFVLQMKKPMIRSAMDDSIDVVSEYQKEIMGSLDQLDDLLAFTEFKETQTNIIREISEIIQLYITHKSDFNDSFFDLTDTIRSNATFRTYTDLQYKEMSDTKTFYEVKTFRLLGSSYIKMITNDRFDIASLIPAEMVDIGVTCLKNNDDTILGHVNIRFNTLFRFAIKHAYKNNEPRNLYNLSFHYSNMIQEYIKADRVDMAKYCYDKFKFYANDIYKNAEANPGLYFVVDTLTFELRKCQVLIHEKGWGNEDQMDLLKMILQLDKPPGYSKDEVDKGILGGNNGTRRIQIGLALFYLSVEKLEFATAIAEDYLDDLAYFDEKTFKANANTQCFLLSIFGPQFWEDTDRGTLNIYFAPEKDQLDPFKELLFGLMDKRLEALERDVKFLSLEVDKLMQKRKRQDGYLNDADKERMEELQRKISAREKTEEDTVVDWSIDHDILYSLLCISFFADQEIDELEKDAIFTSYKLFVPDIDNEIFNRDFGMTTDKFIDLKTEEARQNQFDESLDVINAAEKFDGPTLIKLVDCFVDIANADDFIHENEVTLIQHAIKAWALDITVEKPKSGEKLKIQK